MSLLNSVEAARAFLINLDRFMAQPLPFAALGAVLAIFFDRRNRDREVATCVLTGSQASSSTFRDHQAIRDALGEAFAGLHDGMIEWPMILTTKVILPGGRVWDKNLWYA